MPEFTLPAPLLQAIRRHLSAGQPLTLAIDGCSAAGKTTLARGLQEKYGCPVFHTDDFFFRPTSARPSASPNPGATWTGSAFCRRCFCLCPGARMSPSAGLTAAPWRLPCR
ncbi:MAG: hypothetical protein ACLUNQ_06395 [Oscillospiraceae bacterium]